MTNEIVERQITSENTKPAGPYSPQIWTGSPLLLGRVSVRFLASYN
jgi:hypothetical protein